MVSYFFFVHFSLIKFSFVVLDVDIDQTDEVEILTELEVERTKRERWDVSAFFQFHSPDSFIFFFASFLLGGGSFVRSFVRTLPILWFSTLISSSSSVLCSSFCALNSLSLFLVIRSMVHGLRFTFDVMFFILCSMPLAFRSPRSHSLLHYIASHRADVYYVLSPHPSIPPFSYAPPLPTLRSIPHLILRPGFDIPMFREVWIVR